MAANDHFGPMPAGRARWAPRAMAPDRNSERASCAAHHPALRRNAARPARGAARDRPGRSSRCGPASMRGRGRRQRTQARTESRSCCLALPGRCRARHARHVPEAAARQITKPDSAVHSCRDDRRSRSVAIACRKSANATATWGVSQTRGRRCSAFAPRPARMRCPAARCRSRGSGTPRCPSPAGGHRLPTAHPRDRVSGVTEKGTARHKRPAGQRAARRRRRNPARSMPRQTHRVRRCSERRE